MNPKLSLEYKLSFPISTFDRNSGRFSHKDNEIAIPAEHNDRLEEFIRECLCCHRIVYIKHMDIYLLKFLSKFIYDPNAQLPEIRAMLAAFELLHNAGIWWHSIAHTIGNGKQWVPSN